MLNAIITLRKTAHACLLTTFRLTECSFLFYNFQGAETVQEFVFRQEEALTKYMIIIDNGSRCGSIGAVGLQKRIWGIPRQHGQHNQVPSTLQWHMLYALKIIFDYLQAILSIYDGLKG